MRESRFFHQVIFSLVCFLLPACALAQKPLELNEYRERMEAFALLTYANTRQPPTLNGAHASVVDSALSVRDFRIASQVPSFSGMVQSNPEIMTTYMDAMEAYKLLNKIYERAYRREPQKYGREYLRFYEMNLVTLTNTQQKQLGALGKSVTNAASKPSEQDQKLMESMNSMMGSLQKLLASLVRPILESLVNDIQSKKFADADRSEAIEVLKRSIQLIGDTLSPAERGALLAKVGA
jgi:hypothetical protein